MRLEGLKSNHTEGLLSHQFNNNQPTADLFETLADWEHQLQSLPPDQLDIVVDNLEGLEL